jgi:pyruvate/2-oxoglutarate/acetoin dehydrogenase E1 component
MAHFALEAAQRLADEGVDASVLDLRSLRPLDWPSIELAIRYNGKLLIVHEDTTFAGFGAEIAAQVAEKALDWLDAPVQRYAAPEVPAFPFAPSLEDAVFPSIEGIMERAAALAAY